MNLSRRDTAILYIDASHPPPKMLSTIEEMVAHCRGNRAIMRLQSYGLTWDQGLKVVLKWEGQDGS